MYRTKYNHDQFETISVNASKILEVGLIQYDYGACKDYFPLITISHIFPNVKTSICLSV